MSKKCNFLHPIKLPLILLSVLFFPLIFGNMISVEIKNFFYSISLTMRAIIIFITPFLVFSFLSFSLLNVGSGVLKFLLMLLFMVFLSNFCAINIGMLVSAATVIKLPLPYQNTLTESIILTPLWEVCLPKIIPIEAAILGGFIYSFLFSLYPKAWPVNFASRMNNISTIFLKRIFLPLLPLFILGFVFKLEAEQTLIKSLKIYGPVLLIIVATQIFYLAILYMINANFSLKKFFFYIKNIIPATITGFTTSSSLVTMPILIIATEKNLSDPSFAKKIIPAVINIHTIGSALGLVMLSYATIVTFDMSMPSTTELLQFAFYYAIAKFAVIAIPGGVLITMSPLLEGYLGFTNEMIGLITTIYILIDPFGTAANVTGNGVFAIIFSKLYNAALKPKKINLFHVNKQHIH